LFTPPNPILIGCLTCRKDTYYFLDRKVVAKKRFLKYIPVCDSHFQV